MVARGEGTEYVIPLVDSGVIGVCLVIMVRSEVMFCPLLKATMEDVGGGSVEDVLVELGYRKTEVGDTEYWEKETTSG